MAGGLAKRDVAFAPQYGVQSNARMIAADETPNTGGWGDRLKRAMTGGVPKSVMIGGATVPLFPEAGLPAGLDQAEERRRGNGGGNR